MKKLVSLDVARLHHAEFGQMIVRFFEDLERSTLSINADSDFKKLCENLKEKLPEYNRALDQIRASEETKAIARLDRVRDADFQALKDSLRPYKNAKTQYETDSYTALKLLLSEYRGAEKESYEAETNKLNTLIGRLESGDFSSHVSNLGIGRFVASLSDSNTAFNNLFAKRSFNTSQKETVDVKALRSALYADYKMMVNYIAAMASVKEDLYYKDVFSIINNGRNYFSNIVLARRAGKKSL